MKTKNPYVFEWLDNLITYELNPALANQSQAVETRSDEIIAHVQALRNTIQQYFFKIKEETEAQNWIVKLNDALVTLMNNAYAHLQFAVNEKTLMQPILECVMNCLQDLRTFIQASYAKYLSPEQFVPQVEAASLSAQITWKRESLIEKLRSCGNEDPVIGVVLDALDHFTARIDAAESLTLREVDYHRAIVKDIESYQGQDSALTTCPSLHELLVYWNLNSKACIKYFTAGLEERMAAADDIEAKLEFMRWQSKNIGTMPQIENFTYNPGYPSLKQYFGDYVINEIAYLENKKIGFLPNESYNAEKNKTAPFKVLCALTGDQIAMFLRATKEAKIILAKSVSAVFSSIVPFLSTQKEQELSAQSIRVKAYQGEERDKEILVEALQEIINVVREF